MVEPSVRQLVAIAQNVAPSVGHMEEALSTLIRSRTPRKDGTRGAAASTGKMHMACSDETVYLRDVGDVVTAASLNERNLDDPSGADLFAMFEHYPTHTRSRTNNLYSRN